MSEKQIYFFCSKKTTPQPFNIWIKQAQIKIAPYSN